MEIIRYGNNSILYTIECPCCNSIIKFDDYDERYTTLDYSSMILEKYYITCPCCKSSITTRIISNIINMDYRTKY